MGLSRWKMASWSLHQALTMPANDVSSTTWAKGCSTMPLKVHSSVDLALTSLFTATAITSGLLSVKDVLFIYFSQGIPTQTSRLVSIKSLKEN